MDKKIPEIVFTGGPCAGKTTGIIDAQKRFEKRGRRVIIGREIPTDIILGGVQDIADLAKKDFKKYLEIERRMIWENIYQRRNVIERAKIFKDENPIIFYDRGGMDQKAYLPDRIFEKILKDEGLNYFDVRDCYDGVIHLVTAAKGAEKHYTLRNNEARYETTLKSARDADKKTRNAWLGHPHYRIIDNSTGFEKKMKRAYHAIRSILEPVEIERRFLLKRSPDFTKSALKDSVNVAIEQIYLVSRDGSTDRIRRRLQNGWATYYRTRKSKISGTKFAQEEFEEVISEKDYRHLLKRRDPRAKTIIKNRHHFIYNFQVFELDEILLPGRFWILEKELLHEKEKILLPPFLNIKKEITGDSKYSNFGIAKGL